MMQSDLFNPNAIAPWSPMAVAKARGDLGAERAAAKAERTAPYPADTRAKGWRFELDMERARQSDTWTLAAPEIRPWLLMLWATAWEQTPTGSLPDDDALIAARIGMPLKTWVKHKAILLRRWWKADDGRLYHDVLVQRVREMVTAKDKERIRKAEWRARQSQPPTPPDPSVPPLSRGTDTGRDGDSRGTDGTGTGTGTSTGENRERGDLARAREGPEAGILATRAGQVCGSMRQLGLASVNPGDPEFLKLLEQGATDAEFVGIAKEAVDKSMGFRWVIRTLIGRRADAARLVLVPKTARAADVIPEWRKRQRAHTAAFAGPAAAKPDTKPIEGHDDDLPRLAR